MQELKLINPLLIHKKKENENFVLIKVNAFSCNYRDKAIILKSALKMQEGLNFQASPFAFFGSDFVGTIIDKGASVKDFDIGDRVIPNCAFPKQPFPGVAPGVVTNEASKGWLKLHKSKLITIPNKMSDEIASGYSIGGQTSTSMVRRVNLKDNERALVLSARSNTSMFIINNLLAKGIDTTILTTSDWDIKEKSLISPAKLLKVDKDNPNWERLEGLDNFDVVFDPFFDLHLEKAIKQLNTGGRYITCGYKNQHQNFQDEYDKFNVNNLHEIMLKVMINNMSIIGNCIGTSEDLEESLGAFNPDTFIIPTDSKYDIKDGNKFIEKTYNDNGRLGKSVLIYSS
ncbi:zinc-binding alcohol dehydrogenase family protein [Staphylococcus equorum]|uniref:Zinc-binding alcohol dehydrogenase family protein n=1 Tax=Staphylococcus equorum TaxID=246432 RepID=A0A9X4LCV7_9STAP|nr:zinc-binding alcohol dehydrogenase family protein [Staphylococcus equorum]MDG0843976.1 zinc-binding alcohol dehydrogenase family protein [Staphylococcus equorum]MDG0860267.1 zinc-binding alcohol dehydrogenase family protein [Staphylococcus equorum]